MTNSKQKPRYQRIGLYFDNLKEIQLINQAAKKAGRSRNNWLVRVAVQAAAAQLGKLPPTPVTDIEHQ